jgi:hypothetical protein
VTDLYARDEFIANWASILKVAPEPYAIAVKLINVQKNYQTAMALIFGLSWSQNKEYLKGVTDYFNKNWDATKDTATAEWLGQFVDHYVTEVQKYPEETLAVKQE